VGTVKDQALIDMTAQRERLVKKFTAGPGQTKENELVVLTKQEGRDGSVKGKSPVKPGGRHQKKKNGRSTDQGGGGGVSGPAFLKSQRRKKS